MAADCITAKPRRDRRAIGYTPGAMGPLSGVRVVDCTTVVLGPWAAQQLGDLGADVVKVEPPEGDTTRQLGPMRNPDMGAFYLAVNRNKRSIVLDLKQEAARGVLLRLAEGADVLLHNYRPQAARRLGMSYETFRAVNPGIVYVGTYGFRAAGPYGDKPAYDDIIQAASGLASLQASIMGEPRYVPTIVADKSSSMTVLAAVLAALYHKARTGEGQEVEVPMFESMAAWVMVEHLYGETFMPPIDTIGYKRILNPNRRPFKTKDGYLAILPYTDQNWRDFFILVSRQDLLDDPRYKTLATRLAAHRGPVRGAGEDRDHPHERRVAGRARPAQYSSDDRQYAGGAAARSPSGGGRVLADRGAPERGHAAAPGHPRHLRQDAGRHPASTAATGGAQRGDSPRSGPHRGRGRGTPRRRRHARREVNTALSVLRVSRSPDPPAGASTAECSGRAPAPP